MSNDTVFRICEAVTMLVFFICAAVVLVAPVACTMHRNDLVHQAITAGHDPIAARCALGTSSALADPPCVSKVPNQTK